MQVISRRNTKRMTTVFKDTRHRPSQNRIGGFLVDENGMLQHPGSLDNQKDQLPVKRVSVDGYSEDSNKGNLTDARNVTHVSDSKSKMMKTQNMHRNSVSSDLDAGINHSRTELRKSSEVGIHRGSKVSKLSRGSEVIFLKPGQDNQENKYLSIFQ